MFVKGNLFGESLFLKVPDSIVVRIGKKVHHIRGSFDIVLDSSWLDILPVKTDKRKSSGKGKGQEEHAPCPITGEYCGEKGYCPYGIHNACAPLDISIPSNGT